MKNRAGLRSASSRYRHAYLLVSLLLAVTLRPFLAERSLGLGLIELFLFLALIAGAFATVQNRRQLLLVATLATSVVVLLVTWLVLRADPLLYALLGCGIAFYCVVGFLIVTFLLGATSRVTVDMICGAMSVYVILGLVWSMAYAILEIAVPGSFAINAVGTSGERFERLLGFSFATLTTLGYGNVAPATPRADAIATLEAIAGQIYLAVVIARLVAIQITQSKGTPG